jgi:hypothetical protein
VLREALIAGEVPRGKIETLTGYGDRQSRNIVAALSKWGLLTSLGPRAPLRLAFPATAAIHWFPRIYPPEIEARISGAPLLRGQGTH